MRWVTDFSSKLSVFEQKTESFGSSNIPSRTLPFPRHLVEFLELPYVLAGNTRARISFMVRFPTFQPGCVVDLPTNPDATLGISREVTDRSNPVRSHKSIQRRISCTWISNVFVNDRGSEKHPIRRGLSAPPVRQLSNQTFVQICPVTDHVGRFPICLRCYVRVCTDLSDDT